MKNERAALTIEASLILTLFMIFVLFLLSFNRVYSAQNIVSHAALQTVDAISAESMLRSNANTQNPTDILTVSNHIYAGESIEASALEPLTNANIADIAKLDFIAAIAESETKADEVLKHNGVKNGLAGIDFSGCSYNADTGETIVFVTYTVELQFPIFGLKEIAMTKAAKVTNMGKDTCVVTVKAQNPAMGTTSGTVRVRRNQKTTIVAYPYYGYRFVRWQEDGSTDNPKSLTVDRDMTYTAVFVKADYAIVANVNNSNYGSTTGSGTYKLNAPAVLTATPKVAGGYEFLGWDANGNGVIDEGESTESRLEFKVRRDVALTAVFKPIPYTVTVTTDGRGLAYLTVGDTSLQTQMAPGSSVEMTLDYGTQFNIRAESVDYRFIKWSGTINDTNASRTLTVPVNGGTYKANFEEPWVKIDTNPSDGEPSTNYQYVNPDSNYANVDYYEASSAWAAPYIHSESDFFNMCGVTDSMNLSYNTNIKDPHVSWNSSNPSVVSVDQNGRITVHSQGTATVTVIVSTSDGSYSAQASKRVTARRIMTSVMYRKNKYANDSHNYRHYHEQFVNNWDSNWDGDGGYNSNVGWFYRYQFVDSLPGDDKIVYPGGDTVGRLEHPQYDGGKSTYMNGRNSSDRTGAYQTGYIVFWAGSNPYASNMDIIMFDRGAKLWSVTD